MNEVNLVVLNKGEQINGDGLRKTALRFPYQNWKKKLGIIPRLKIQAMATDPHYTKPK